MLENAGAARAPMTSARPNVLHARGVTKRFPGVLAVDDIEFAVQGGEIVALLGPNGAGKSTLIQILAGVHPHGSFEGEIEVGGAPYRPRSVAEAERGGIAFVPQEINVVPDLTVAQNLFLHCEPTRWGCIDRSAQLTDARKALDDFSLDVDATAPMGMLDLATQQLVIILRALSKNPALLILDEPTAALTDSEAQLLFDKLRVLRERGVGIIFVSHRLAEVFSISDRIVVMRDGRVCGSFETAATSRDVIVTLMVGSVTAPASRVSPTFAEDDALRVSHLVVADDDERRRLRVDDQSFTLRKGEILGLFGLLGAGCQESALATFGAWQGRTTGRIAINGRDVEITRPADAIAHGMGLIAQDRRYCLLPEHSILDNILLPSLGLFCRNGFVDWLELRRRVVQLAKQLNIKAASIDVAVGTLSGGNQQKVQVARWLLADMKILLLVDPTRGVDVGARAELTRVWRELAAAGCALLLVSSEVEELVENCDRVLVMRDGRTMSELAGAELTEERLLRLAAGV